MKTLRLATMTALLFCLLGMPLALAADAAKEVGYIDLEWITIPENASEIQDIDLGPILLNIAADAQDKGDDVLVQALSMVRSIRVKAFSVSADGADDVQKSVDKVAAKLKKDDWKRLIYMKDGEETVSVNTKYDGPDLVGLMIVTYEPGDSVAFVNVVGDLDLGTLLSLAHQLDHDSIQEMLGGLEGTAGAADAGSKADD